MNRGKRPLTARGRLIIACSVAPLPRRPEAKTLNPLAYRPGEASSRREISSPDGNNRGVSGNPGTETVTPTAFAETGAWKDTDWSEKGRLETPFECRFQGYYGCTFRALCGRQRAEPIIRD